MGTMTRLEILTEVKENLDNREDVTDTQGNRWINHVYSHLTHPSIHEFEDLAVTYDITLVSGTASYSLAAATVGFRILMVRAVSYLSAASGSITTDTRRRLLVPKPIQWYDQRQHPSTTEPSNYVLGEGQTILISNTPVNTNTVRLRVFQEAASLSADNSTTVLPEYFDEVLVSGSLAFFEYKLGMRDRANESFQIYNSLIANAAPKDLLEIQSWGTTTQLVGEPHMGTS